MTLTDVDGQLPAASTTRICALRAGQVTQARVWVQNRGRGEAVPISLQEATLDTPLRVRIVNAQSSQVTDEPIHARLLKRSHQTVTAIRP